MPRHLLALLALLASVVVGLPGGSLVGNANAQAEDNGFVGSWLVSPTIDEATAVALTTFTADGAILTSDRPSQSAPPELGIGPFHQSLGHGRWEATGPNEAAVTFVFLQTDPQGAYLGTRTIRGRLTLGPSGDRWSGDFTATIADAAGTVVAESVGRVSATRITVEPLSGTRPPAIPATITPGTDGWIEVTGAVASPRRWTVDDLRSLPARRVDVVWRGEDGQWERHWFVGASLADLVARAEPRFPAVIDGEGTAYLVVTAADGVSSVVAWGEIAPGIGETPAILAWEQDGTPLPADRQPVQLVVAGDRSSPRSVWAVASIEVRIAD